MRYSEMIAREKQRHQHNARVRNHGPAGVPSVRPAVVLIGGLALLCWMFLL